MNKTSQNNHQKRIHVTHCDQYALKITLSKDDDKAVLQQSLDAHHTLADEGYVAKSEDKKLSTSDDSIVVLAFDMQQCLSTPNLDSSVALYKRLLWTFNLPFHNCTSNQAHCFMWCEVDGGRGSNQVASYVARHLSSIPPHVKRVIITRIPVDKTKIKTC
ncbi:hypothetical protein PR048_005823 [Dryococelus australis]|uniref:Uncharacterized protein n=1 Tax=Dryococelus australis TaxID=614101 RepID=A0ABQ9I993_9NEOP|nr:hypothetical protein PR048_005823 [Dryococelus australis]